MTNQIQYRQFESVWDALEDTPPLAENMKARSMLMIALREHVRAKGWSQVEAAKHLDVTQPRISDLMRGKINLFSLDMLITMLACAGMQVEMTVSPIT